MTWELYGAERKAAGKYIRNVELIREWINGGTEIPEATAAKMFCVTPSVFEGVVNLIKEHPDWDDADIADKADWR